MWLKFLLLFVMWWSVNTAEQVNGTGELPLKDCLDSENIVPCLAEKAASTFEKSLNSNIHLLDGLELLRNDQKINPRRAKSLDGVQRLFTAVSDFIDTHSFSIDLTRGRALDDDDEEYETEEAKPKRGGGGGGGGGFGGGGGGGMFNRKALKKERKYYQYAFMVLLGIFGLTGPLFMKILGIIAAKSLLAAKAALIIVGGVALKKIFENSKHQPKVKVTTLPIHGHESEEDHDRFGYSFNHIPYGYGAYGNNPYHDPYSAHYPVSNSLSDNEQFAPVFYGSQKTKS